MKHQPNLELTIKTFEALTSIIGKLRDILVIIQKAQDSQVTNNKNFQ